MYFSDRWLLDVLADESFGEEELFWASGVSSPDNISPILSSAGTSDNGFLLGVAVFVAIREQLFPLFQTLMKKKDDSNKSQT